MSLQSMNKGGGRSDKNTNPIAGVIALIIVLVICYYLGGFILGLFTGSSKGSGTQPGVSSVDCDYSWTFLSNGYTSQYVTFRGFKNTNAKGEFEGYPCQGTLSGAALAKDIDVYFDPKSGTARCMSTSDVGSMVCSDFEISYSLQV